jgi:teichuronic acid biosynthesis glycosyltransferase TuaC
MGNSIPKIRVLVFTSLYPNNIWPNHGVFIKERMVSVAKLYNCQMIVVAPVPYYPPIRVGWRSSYTRVVKEEFIDDIKVYHPRYFMIPKIAMFLQGWLMCLSILPAIKRIQRNFPFELIDSHYVYPDGFAAVLIGRLLRTPVIVSARGSDINLFSRFPIICRFLKYALGSASHVIAVSSALRKRIVKLGIPDSKISVIPNGVDRRKFKRMTDKREARRELGLRRDGFIVLSVGGLTPVKGFDVLIKAFEILVNNSGQRKPYLTIVGEGTLRKDLETIISQLHLESHVHLVGAVPHERLCLWYNAADIFCLASEQEGWPNVILEAMACGLPVVASAVGGIPEILTDSEVGLLSERDPVAMAQRIREAMQKNWDSERISRNARKYTWDATAAEVRAVFDEVKTTPIPALACCSSSSRKIG